MTTTFLRAAARTATSLLAASALLAAGAGAAVASPAQPTPPDNGRHGLRALHVSTPQVVLRPGRTVELAASGAFANGRTEPVVPTWRSSDPTVVTVDAAGVVRAVAPGTTTVVASLHRQVAEVRVRVVEPTITARLLGNINGTPYYAFTLTGFTPGADVVVRAGDNTAQAVLDSTGAVAGAGRFVVNAAGRPQFVVEFQPAMALFTGFPECFQTGRFAVTATDAAGVGLSTTLPC
jgi:hypothetical protein